MQSKEHSQGQGICMSVHYLFTIFSQINTLTHIYVNASSVIYNSTYYVKETSTEIWRVSKWKYWMFELQWNSWIAELNTKSHKNHECVILLWIEINISILMPQSQNHTYILYLWNGKFIALDNGEHISKLTNFLLLMWGFNNKQSYWRWWNSSWAISNPKRWCCESATLNMPANLENLAVATGLEKVSFHSNPKERQCQRMLILLPNCTHLTH